MTQACSRVQSAKGYSVATGAEERAARAAHDDALATSLRATGLQEFVQQWYQQPMWRTLRRHPSFKRLVARRASGES